MYIARIAISQWHTHSTNAYVIFYGFELIKTQINWIIIILKINGMNVIHPLCVISYLFIMLSFHHKFKWNHISFSSDSSISQTNLITCLFESRRWSCNQAKTVNLLDVCVLKNNIIKLTLKTKNCARPFFCIHKINQIIRLFL